MWMRDIALRAAMPIIIAMLSPAMESSVAEALRLLGGRKVGTPLLTASTPVSAVQPEANARSSRMMSAAPTGPPCEKPSDADSATGVWPTRTCLLYTSDAADDLTRVDLGG